MQFDLISTRSPISSNGCAASLHSVSVPTITTALQMCTLCQYDIHKLVFHDRVIIRNFKKTTHKWNTNEVNKCNCMKEWVYVIVCDSVKQKSSKMKWTVRVLSIHNNRKVQSFITSAVGYSLNTQQHWKKIVIELEIKCHSRLFHIQTRVTSHQFFVIWIVDTKNLYFDKSVNNFIESVLVVVIEKSNVTLWFLWRWTFEFLQ
jgi:hypothetical protein